LGLHICTGMFHRKEVGIQVLAALAPSSQTLQSLLRILWLANPTRKIA
jgi:hypothetical protein